MKRKRAAEVLSNDASQVGSVVITQPKVSKVVLEITGTAGLIQNVFNQKALEQMLKKHMGISVVREPKKPRQVLEDAKCKNIEGRICIPPAAIKKAMLSASTAIKDLKKTQLRQQLWIVGQSIPITYTSEVPRMDLVRLAGIGRKPDVRFRPMFEGWKARVAIQFTDPLVVASVVDLLNRAGKVGVCEWRPERDGSFGTFSVTRHIAKADEIAEVHEECAVPLVPLVVPSWALDADIDPELLSKVFSEASEGVEAAASATDEEAAS